MNTAIIVSAHGSIESLDEIPAFLLRIRRGRPPSPELIHEVTQRYSAIGGSSPLLQITLRQASAVADRVGVSGFVGMRLSAPSIESAVEHALAEGCTQLVSLPLTPYSLSLYHGAVRRVVNDRVPLLQIPEYHCHPQLIAYFAAQILSWVSEQSKSFLPEKLQVIFTAHSLPQQVIDAGDRYAILLAQAAEKTSELVRAKLLESTPEFTFAYQSAGASEGPWIGPTLLDSLKAAASANRTQVLVVPIGFYSDHVEILYDLDIEAQGWARELGLTMARSKTPNDCDALCSALAQIVQETLDSAGNAT